MNNTYRRVIVVLGGLMIAVSAYVLKLGALNQAVPSFLIAFGVWFLLYVASILLLSRMHEPYRRTVQWIVAVALVIRVFGLLAPVSLSDDIYRYLWEGRVVSEGHNPFALAPDAPELAYLRDDNVSGINHSDLPTIYPPAAQAVFALGAIIKPNIATQKLVLTFFDLGTILIVFLLLRFRRMNLHLLAVYAWSPLVVIEFAFSGHIDSLGIFFLMLFVLLFERGSNAGGFAALASSFLSKYSAGVLGPFFLFKPRYWKWLLLSAFVVVIGYLPFAAAKSGLFDSLGLYSRHWYFNSFVFATLRHVVTNPDWLRIGLASAGLTVMLWQGYRQRDVMRYLFFAIGVTLVFLPTVYPWYVCWIVPFLCFYRSRAWLLFTGLVVAAYAVWIPFLNGGAWELGWSTLLIEYVPFYALLMVEGYRTWRRSARGVVQ